MESHGGRTTEVQAQASATVDTKQESSEQFEKRKQDHLKWALDSKTQAVEMNDLHKVVLQHEALPEIDFKEVDISTSFFSSFEDSSTNFRLTSPLFISSMTAGHEQGELINDRLAGLSHRHQILMGVGSQRKELIDKAASQEWALLRKKYPKALFLGNLGIAQVIQTPVSDVQRLVDSLESKAFIIHLNSLQEVLQPEGTPQFSGALVAIEKLVKGLSVPVIVKEVGCGFSQKTLEKLMTTGVFAVDVAALGGTHWGRLEGFRSEVDSKLYGASHTFSQWGWTQLESLLHCQNAVFSGEFWASGGIRSGLDVAKCIALGAKKVGSALPFLQKSLESEVALEELLDQWNYELKVALFCTGSKTLQDLKGRYIIRGQI